MFLGGLIGELPLPLQHVQVSILTGYSYYINSYSDPDVPEGIQEENGIQYEFCLYQRQQ